MVPLSKSGVRKHRGFESRPLRHPQTSDDPAINAGSFGVRDASYGGPASCHRSAGAAAGILSGGEVA